jgi:hypothetical protein
MHRVVIAWIKLIRIAPSSLRAHSRGAPSDWLGEHTMTKK